MNSIEEKQHDQHRSSIWIVRPFRSIISKRHAKTQKIIVRKPVVDCGRRIGPIRRAARGETVRVWPCREFATASRRDIGLLGRTQFYTVTVNREFGIKAFR